MIKREIANVFIATLQNLIKKQIFPKFVQINKLMFTVNMSRRKFYGDFTTNILLLLSKVLKKQPKLLTEIFIKNIVDPAKMIADIKYMEPGFLNLKISNTVLLSKELRKYP